MWHSKILQLLSQHRQPGQRALPATLSRTQVLSLLRQCVEPDYPDEQLREDVQKALQVLEAQQELLKAVGNRYCVAPPTLLAASQESLVGLRFRGDRAYLPLAHEILKTNQPPTEEKLNPTLVNFERAKDRLQASRIRLLTLTDLVSELPIPQKPQQSLLQPYQSSGMPTEIQHYCPAYAEQQARWQSSSLGTLPDESLVRRSDDKDERYLWFEANQFYELDRDTAIYTMFYLDHREQQPIHLVLEPTGKLNLQNIWLPDAYYQWCQQLWEPLEGERRVYNVLPANQPFVRAVFQRLGCDLR